MFRTCALVKISPSSTPNHPDPSPRNRRDSMSMSTAARLHLSIVFWSGVSRVGGGGEFPFAVSAGVGRTGVVTVGSSGGFGASGPRGGTVRLGAGGETLAGWLLPVGGA